MLLPGRHKPNKGKKTNRLRRSSKQDHRSDRPGSEWGGGAVLKALNYSKGPNEEEHFPPKHRQEHSQTWGYVGNQYIEIHYVKHPDIAINCQKKSKTCAAWTGSCTMSDGIWKLPAPWMVGYRAYIEIDWMSLLPEFGPSSPKSWTEPLQVLTFTYAQCSSFTQQKVRRLAEVPFLNSL